MAFACGGDPSTHFGGSSSALAPIDGDGDPGGGGDPPPPPPPPPPPSGGGTTTPPSGSCGTPTYDGRGVAALSQLVCGVGESNGSLAISFLGRWFSVPYNSGSWGVVNNVAANAASVAPTDQFTTDQTPRCPVCRTRMECLDECGAEVPPRVRHQIRTYVVTVGAMTYTVRAEQTIHDQIYTSPSGISRRGTADLAFTITANDPGDGNPWTVIVLPKRSHIGGYDDDVTLNDALTDGDEEAGGEYELVSGTDMGYSQDVELSSAIKNTAGRATESLSTSNQSLDAALEGLMGTPGANYQSESRPEAMLIAGTLDDTLTGGSDSGPQMNLVMDRFSRFYMKGRSAEGYSSPGIEYPMLITQTPSQPGTPNQNRQWQWSWRHNITHQEVYFPFLAGICGLEAHLDSSISASVNYGRQVCFRGAVQYVDLSGRTEFVLEAGGGFGCNLFFVSASAGLEAAVKAGVEFQSTYTPFPPALNSSLTLYSTVSFQGYFRVRVLFWKKKWEKTIASTRTFNRSASTTTFEVPNPPPNLCDPQFESEFPDMWISSYYGATPSGPVQPPIPQDSILTLQGNFDRPGEVRLELIGGDEIMAASHTADTIEVPVSSLGPRRNLRVISRQTANGVTVKHVSNWQNIRVQ